MPTTEKEEHILGSPGCAILGNNVEVVEYCEFALPRFLGPVGLERSFISISGDPEAP